ncbi:hypothetical protein FM106_00025 [Brachybacterium faecium]|nr:hypothetical protein FM106_00025 [Brachybacterium faecium]
MDRCVPRVHSSPFSYCDAPRCPTPERGGAAPGRSAQRLSTASARPQNGLSTLPRTATA